jgi:DNA-binding MarR family transcriptional regulator
MKIEDVIQTKFKSPQQKAIVNIRYTSNYLGNIQNAIMGKFDLTMPQFNILRILRGAKVEINVNTVKERMLEKSPNTTRLMDKLIEKGLIERKRSKDDKRVVNVQITKKGLDLLAEIDENSEIKKLMQPNISDEEANLLSDILDKLRKGYVQ